MLNEKLAQWLQIWSMSFLNIVTSRVISNDSGKKCETLISLYYINRHNTVRSKAKKYIAQIHFKTPKEKRQYKNILHKPMQIHFKTQKK